MSAHTPDPGITTADFAVLKSQFESMASAITEMRSSMSTNFGAVNARFEMMTGLVQQLTRMQERQESHSDGLGRAFKDVEALQRQLDAAEAEWRQWQQKHETDTNAYREALLAERDAWRAAHEARHAEIDKRSNLVRGITLGVAAVYTVTLALLIWIANGLISKLDTVDDRTHEIQLQLARDSHTAVTPAKLPPGDQYANGP